MKKNYIDYEKTDVHHKKLCKYCKKPLRRFKRNSYGSNRRDWGKRDLHLKCWKKKGK
jgi:hypothetical protein